MERRAFVRPITEQCMLPEIVARPGWGARSFLVGWLESRSNCSDATRGLLATDYVILNHGQVTWTTPELAPPSPNYHTTPTGGRFSSRQI
ncbi:hypothetical protein TNCV_770221 [Trichonephila clavipes]|nr:hypothetical protein TNCV_770221 [Trichonephila clavipes]